MLHGNPKSMWRRLLRKSCESFSVPVNNPSVHCNPVVVIPSTPIRCIHPAPVSTSSQDNHSSGVRAGRLNHIAIAVPNVEEAAQTFEKVLGSKVSQPQLLREHGVKVVFVSLENTKLELLEPLGEASPISKFLKKNPVGGMHHLCIEVPDIEVRHMMNVARQCRVLF